MVEESENHIIKGGWILCLQKKIWSNKHPAAATPSSSFPVVKQVADKLVLPPMVMIGIEGRADTKVSLRMLKMAPFLIRPPRCAKTHRSTGNATTSEEARRYILSFA